MEKVLQLWLDHQCRILTGSKHAVLLSGPPDQGPYDRILFWPDRHYDYTMLSRVAQVALRDKKTVIKSFSNKGEKTAEPLDVLACPLFLADKLLGVVAIERTHHFFSKQRAVMQQVQTGAMWLEAMIELPLDPALGSKKTGNRLNVKSVFEPVQSRYAKLLGPNRLPLKVGVGLAAILLVGLFLISTLLRVSSDSASETVIRHAVVATKHTYIIKTQVPSGDALGDVEGVVTLDKQEPSLEAQAPQSQVGQLSQAQSRAPTGVKNTKTPADPVLSEDKISPLTAADASAQKSIGANERHVLKAETETTTTKPIEAIYSIKIGPILKEQELKEATNILHGNGINFQQVIGMGPVKVTRLLEGLYTPDKANERFNAIQDVVDSAFIIKEKGKLAIYVATYHDRAKAIQELKQLAQKNIKVTAVTTELKMKGAILVVEHVDRSYIETVTDQVSKLGLSVKVIKSGLVSNLSQ